MGVARAVLGALALLTAASLGAAQAAELLPAPQLGPDGLWVQDWYRPTTGDLRRDLGQAAAEGLILAVFWEAAGCEYCADLHLTALRVPAVRDTIRNGFYVVRLNRFGTTPIVDFDGEARSERAIFARHGVRGTPAVEFRIADGTEVFRLPGYAEPPVLRAVFEYVQTGGYLYAPITDWLRTRGLL